MVSVLVSHLLVFNILFLGFLVGAQDPTVCRCQKEGELFDIFAPYSNFDNGVLILPADEQVCIDRESQRRTRRWLSERNEERGDKEELRLRRLGSSKSDSAIFPCPELNSVESTPSPVSEPTEGPTEVPDTSIPTGSPSSSPTSLPTAIPLANIESVAPTPIPTSDSCQRRTIYGSCDRRDTSGLVLQGACLDHSCRDFSSPPIVSVQNGGYYNWTGGVPPQPLILFDSDSAELASVTMIPDQAFCTVHPIAGWRLVGHRCHMAPDFPRNEADFLSLDPSNFDPIGCSRTTTFQQCILMVYAELETVACPSPTDPPTRLPTRRPSSRPTSSPTTAPTKVSTFAPTSMPMSSIETSMPSKLDCGTNLLTDTVNVRFIGVRTCAWVALNTDSCRLSDDSRNGQAVRITCVRQCTPGCPATAEPTLSPVSNIQTTSPTSTPLANIETPAPSKLDCGTNLLTDTVNVRFIGVRTCAWVALNTDSCRLSDDSRNGQAVRITCVRQCMPGCPATAEPTLSPVSNIQTTSPTSTPLANIETSAPAKLDCGTNLPTLTVDIRFVGVRACAWVALNTNACRLSDDSRGGQAVSITCVRECTPGCV